jgi:hypothetical protein
MAEQDRTVTGDWVVVTLLVMLLPALAHAQEFSAEVVYAVAAAQPSSATLRPLPPPPAPARIYVNKDKARIEFAGLTGQTLIVDEAARSTLVLFRSQKSYQQLGSRPAQYFRVSEVANGCSSWQIAAGRQFDCRQTGIEVLGGRQVIRYERVVPKGAADIVWVDPKLHYVVKWRMSGLEAELRDIKEGPQAADIFAIPSDFEPVKPPRKRSSMTVPAPH